MPKKTESKKKSSSKKISKKATVAKKTKKIVSKKENDEDLMLVICKECKLQLVMPRRDSKSCEFCFSTNLSVEKWR